MLAALPDPERLDPLDVLVVIEGARFRRPIADGSDEVQGTTTSKVDDRSVPPHDEIPSPVATTGERTKRTVARDGSVSRTVKVRVDVAIRVRLGVRVDSHIWAEHGDAGVVNRRVRRRVAEAHFEDADGAGLPRFVGLRPADGLDDEGIARDVARCGAVHRRRL